MKLEELRKELQRIESAYEKHHDSNNKRAKSMLDAIWFVVMPIQENDERVTNFLRLIMSCSEIGKNKNTLIQFTTSIISADYFLSIKREKKAIPFLNRALKLYCEWMGENTVLEIKDADAFIDEFRAAHLKRQSERKNQAINNIYICCEAGRRLNIHLHLEELLVNDVPSSWHVKRFAFLLIMALVSGSFLGIPLAESMAPWRAANESGNPISIFDAWQPMDLPLLYAGFAMFFLTIWYTLWVGSKSYINVMSKVAYWKFNR